MADEAAALELHGPWTLSNGALRLRGNAAELLHST